MNRTDIIRKLAERFGYTSYLEIGVKSGVNFMAIPCPHKVGVDPDPNSRATIFKTSDDFFMDNDETFDLIFIDGDHDGDQVLEDVVNALRVLNPGGAIVMHDCNPLTEHAQRPASEFVPGEHWNGTAWRAFVELRTRYDLRMCVVNADEGVGIIMRGNQMPLTEGANPSYSMLENNRRIILNLISPDALDLWLDKTDVLLVKYTENERDRVMWNYTKNYIESSNVSLRIMDNDQGDNIGLVMARRELLRGSESAYVVLMDFDFRGLYLDFDAMRKKLDEPGVGMVVPWTPPADINREVEWEEKKYVQCSCMMMRRDILESIGELDSKFNTAYGDWDLIQRIWDAGLTVMQHNRSYAVHAPTPKDNRRAELWKKDYDAYIKKHGSPMERREQPPRIVVADWDGSHFKWLHNFMDYLARRGFSVFMATAPQSGDHLSHWRNTLAGAKMVFVWNGAHPIYQPIIRAAQELAIPHHILEVGWFPQSKNFFVDPTGINCRASIVEDDLEWVGERQYRKLDKLRREIVGDRRWKGGGYVLVPLQLEEDMNWLLDGGVGSMQDFITHTEDRFRDKKIVFKRHPLDPRSYRLMLSRSEFLTEGNFLDIAQNAELVYGVNSTCLLEASLMGVPVMSVGGGYLRAHESQVQKMLAALADKQIPVSEKNLDYWFGDILGELSEKLFGHSELPWGRLDNEEVEVLEFCKGDDVRDAVASLKRKPGVGVIVIDNGADIAGIARKCLKGIDHLVIKHAFVRERNSASAYFRERPKMKQGVSVVVSCYNQCQVMPLFLESMFFQTVPPNEVIVADDGSDDGVAGWIKENAGRYPFPIHFVTRAHDGYRLASLENMGVKHCSYSRILFTNADVIHSPASIESHLDVKGVGAGIVKGIAVGSVNLVAKENIRDFELIRMIQKKDPSWRHNGEYMKATNPNHNPIGVWGGNFSVPTDKFMEVGGFDESFTGWGGEDNDLTMRLVKAGCHVDWVWGSEVIHLDHDIKDYAYQQEGSDRYMKKMGYK